MAKTLKFWMALLGSTGFFLCTKAQQPLFNLKKGDWFVMDVQLDQQLEGNGFDRKTLKPITTYSTSSNDFVVWCEIGNTTPSGGQILLLRVDRARSRHLDRDGSLTGFDSFYPSFDTYRQQSQLNLPAYQIQVSPTGKIESIDLTNTPTETVQSSELSPAKPNYSVTSISAPVSEDNIRLFAALLTLPVKQAATKTLIIQRDTADIQVTRVHEQEKFHVLYTDYHGQTARNLYDRRTGVPILICPSDSITMLLTDASFAWAGNARVAGKINAQNERTFNLRILDHVVEVNPNGEFLLDMKTNYPVWGSVVYDNDSIPLLVSPGDSIYFEIDRNNLQSAAHQIARVSPPNKLVQRIASLHNTYKTNQHPQQYLLAESTVSKAIDSLLAAFDKLVPKNVLDYLAAEAYYANVSRRLGYLVNWHIMANQQVRDVSFNSIPPSYLAAIDSLHLFKSRYTHGSYYNRCIARLRTYQKVRLNIGGARPDLYKDYSLAVATLQGYPLYASLSELLVNEINANNWRRNEAIKHLYTDFLSRCKDTALTNPVQRLLKANGVWKPGNASPVDYLPLAGGKKLQLASFKGKPLAVLINRQQPTGLINLMEAIARGDASVHYILAQAANVPKPSGDYLLSERMETYEREQQAKFDQLDSVLRKRSNVTMVTIDVDALPATLHKQILNGAQLIILDRWMRVVEYTNNGSPGGNEAFHEAIENAGNVSRLSAEQRSALKKMSIWTAIPILGTALLVGLFFRTRIRLLKNREAVKRRIKDLEIKAIRSQMNPHFIFNSLNSIQSLITEKRFRDANDYLAEFSTLLRSVLKNSEQRTVALTEELEAVAYYCRLEQLRFDFSYSITLADHIDPKLMEVPGMILQPLVENAIVHGISKRKSGEGKLQLTVTATPQVLHISIEDNGPGLPINGPPITKGNGLGLKLVEERIQNFNGNEKKSNLTLRNRTENGHIVGVIATLSLLIG